MKNDFKKLNIKRINQLKEGEYSEVTASLVQVFKRNPFYEVCPTCESRLEKDGDVWKCKNHEKVEPKYNMVISGIIDDGSGNIRAVFFREAAEKVFCKDAGDLKKSSSEEPLNVYNGLKLGEGFVLRGTVKKNQFTERMEFVVNELERIDPKKECEKLINILES